MSVARFGMCPVRPTRLPSVDAVGPKQWLLQAEFYVTECLLYCQQLGVLSALHGNNYRGECFERVRVDAQFQHTRCVLLSANEPSLYTNRNEAKQRERRLLAILMRARSAEINIQHIATQTHIRGDNSALVSASDCSAEPRLRTLQSNTVIYGTHTLSSFVSHQGGIKTAS